MLYLNDYWQIYVLPYQFATNEPCLELQYYL